MPNQFCPLSSSIGTVGFSCIVPRETLLGPLEAWKGPIYPYQRMRLTSPTPVHCATALRQKTYLMCDTHITNYEVEP